MQLLSNCQGKVIFTVGIFNDEVIKELSKKSKQLYYWQANSSVKTEDEYAEFVAVEFSEIVELPEQSCDYIIVSYAMLFLERNERVLLINNFIRLLKPDGEIIIFEPVDEALKNQQDYLKSLKNILLNDSIDKRNPLIMPSVSSICNLLENAGFRIGYKEKLSGLQAKEKLPLPYKNESSEASVHLLIRASGFANTESVSYNVNSEPEKLLPREKLLGGYIEEMKLSELLAIIIGMGNKQEDVHSMTERIIREYGFKALAGEKDPKRMMEILSIGEVNACKLVSTFEIGRRFYSEKVKGRQLIRGPEDVYKYAAEMAGLVKENFRGLYLNTKNYIIHDEVISIGHLTASLVHPREVFKPAIEYSAAGLIVLHNHPSGDPEPSVQDKEITEMLVKAGKTLGIPLLDHVIIGTEKFYSFNEKGMI